MVFSILDGLLGDTVVLDVEESGVDSSLAQLSSKNLTVLKFARVESCQVDDWNLLWSAVARWHIQDISENWSVSRTQLEFGSGRLGLCHFDVCTEEKMKVR